MNIRVKEQITCTTVCAVSMLVHILSEQLTLWNLGRRQHESLLSDNLHFKGRKKVPIVFTLLSTTLGCLWSVMNEYTSVCYKIWTCFLGREGGIANWFGRLDTVSLSSLGRQQQQQQQSVEPVHFDWRVWRDSLVHHDCKKHKFWKVQLFFGEWQTFRTLSFFHILFVRPCQEG
jgi:hypothetical protein